MTRVAAIVKLEGARLVPLTPWDAELLSECKPGQEFDLVRRSKRSAPHSGMYWAQLGLIVKATDAFPTAEKMHVWIKCRLGYTAPIFGPNGHVIGMTVDSTGFEKMDQAEFNVFYEKAAQLIAHEMGIDLAQVKRGWAI